jgi:hypothetical protein
MNKILSIRTTFLSLAIIPFLFSCSKKEGCNFNEALNYDNEVVVDDGSCTFTNFTFYADTTYYNGLYIDQIDIKFDRVLIGSFSGMEADASACGGSNTTSYTPRSVENISWTSELHLIDTVVEIDTSGNTTYMLNDTVLFTSGEARTAPTLECYEINVLF